MKIGKKDLGYKINLDSGDEELILPKLDTYTPEQLYLMFSAFFKLSSTFLEFFDGCIPTQDNK